MNFNNKYRLLLYKDYLDTGMGLTSYVKYLIAFFGLASADVKTTMWIAAGYAVFCFLLGYAYYRYEWVLAGHEVGNRYNLFQKEVREKLK